MTIGTTTDNATGESASSGSGGQDPQGSGVRFVLAHVDTLHDNPTDRWARCRYRWLSQAEGR